MKKPLIDFVPSTKDGIWFSTKIPGLECTKSGKLRYTADSKYSRTTGEFVGTPVWGYSKLRGRYVKALQIRDPRTNRMANVGHIILETFGYVRPKGFEVDHIDHNCQNNSLSNVRYLSHSDNLRHRRAYMKNMTQHGWWLFSQKQKYNVSKLSELPEVVRREYWRRQKRYLRSQKQPQMKQAA